MKLIKPIFFRRRNYDLQSLISITSQLSRHTDDAAARSLVRSRVPRGYVYFPPKIAGYTFTSRKVNERINARRICSRNISPSPRSRPLPIRLPRLGGSYRRVIAGLAAAGLRRKKGPSSRPVNVRIKPSPF